MSFYTFMMRKYKGTNTPEGDLAADMELYVKVQCQVQTDSRASGTQRCM